MNTAKLWQDKVGIPPLQFWYQAKAGGAHNLDEAVVYLSRKLSLSTQEMNTIRHHLEISLMLIANDARNLAINQLWMAAANTDVSAGRVSKVLEDLLFTGAYRSVYVTREEGERIELWAEGLPGWPSSVNEAPLHFDCEMRRVF